MHIHFKLFIFTFILLFLKILMSEMCYSIKNRLHIVCTQYSIIQFLCLDIQLYIADDTLSLGHRLSKNAKAYVK